MNVSDSTLKEIRSLVIAGQKIEAIKLLRQHVPVSLADAVKVVEWVEKDDSSAPMPTLAPTGASFPSGVGSNRRNTGVPRLVSLIFLGVGVILLSVTAWLVTSELSFQKTAGRADGVVAENIRSGRNFRPVFEFDWKGEKLRVESNVASSVNGRPAYRVGEKVTLFVDPSDPYQSHVDSWFGSWFAATITGVLGGIFAAIGGCVLVFSGRR